MKALSVTQPWAQLIADGRKRVETRTWSTHYRGWLAIHASAGWRASDRDYAQTLGYGVDLRRGSVVALVVLMDVVPVERIRDHLSEAELRFGDYADGRYAWLLSGVLRLPTPIPARGALSLWSWPAGDALTPRRYPMPSPGHVAILIPGALSKRPHSV